MHCWLHNNHEDYHFWFPNGIIYMIPTLWHHLKNSRSIRSSNLMEKQRKLRQASLAQNAMTLIGLGMRRSVGLPLNITQGARLLLPWTIPQNFFNINSNNNNINIFNQGKPVLQQKLLSRGALLDN